MFQNLDRLDSLARMGKLGPISSVELISRNHPDYSTRFVSRIKSLPKIHKPSFKEMAEILIKKFWKWILKNKSLIKFIFGILWMLFKIFD